MGKYMKVIALTAFILLTGCNETKKNVQVSPLAQVTPVETEESIPAALGYDNWLRLGLAAIIVWHYGFNAGE